MDKILITAFNAFGSNSTNPSESLLKSLNEEGVAKLLLPTVYGEAEDLLIKTALEEKPKAIVLLGYSKTANPIRLELFARNRDSEMAKDNHGQVGKRPIIAGAPPKLKTTLPTDEIERVWREHGVTFKTSVNAGGFLCNHVWYVVLYWLASCGLENTPCGFVHIGKGQEAREESHKAIKLLLHLLRGSF